MKAKDIMCSIKDNRDQGITNRQGTADVFADFYASLFCSSLTEKEGSNYTSRSGIPRFTEKELATEIRVLRNKKAKDKAGVTAELLETGGRWIREAILYLFNSIASDQTAPPQGLARDFHHGLINCFRNSFFKAHWCSMI